YHYQVVVPSSDRSGAMFNVQVVDAASADAQMPAMGQGSSAGGAQQSILFAAPVAQTADSVVLTIDTSSLSVVPDDQSFLDSALSQFFGIVVDVTDAVQSFTTVIAHTVQASFIAATNLFAKTFGIVPGGSITVPRGADQIAGESWLNAGASSVFVANA